MRGVSQYDDMFKYLLLRHALISFLLSEIIYVVSVIDPTETISDNSKIIFSGFWGDVLGGVVIFIIFKHLNLWILYSNLLKHKYKYLIYSFLVYFSLVLVINSFF